MKTGKPLQDAETPGGELLPAALVPSRQEARRRLIGFLGFIGLLALAFLKPLIALANLALETELHSQILLVPFISVYLLYTNYGRMGVPLRSSLGWALIPVAVGIAALGWRMQDSTLSHNDVLTLTALAFVCFVAAGGFLFLGKKWMAAAAFPIGFLIFMVPLPDAAVDAMETASKLGSTEVANVFFEWSGTPVIRDGTFFKLPGIMIEVAQECSGIRSSWVLFITSLLASHIFLKSQWRRAILVAFVIPLGLLRNGFRILVIGLLCVHIGPEMIHHAIHKRGGPVFFALSLIPLFLLLWWLRKGETVKKTAQPV